MANNFEQRVLDEFASIVGGTALNAGPFPPASGGTGALASALATVFKSGFGLSPLIGGIISLFGGGHSDETAPPFKYQLPAALDISRAQTASGTYESDYDQTGNARTVGGPGKTSTQGAAAGQQVTVNIQAMDARSFLDRSSDIAAAVREAMLNLSSLNDVIADL